MLGKKERRGEKEKKKASKVCVLECVKVRNCACLSVRSIRAEQIRMCRSY